MDEHKKRIRALLLPIFQDHALDDDENIFALGVVNSLFAMQLVLLVEKEFNVAIESEDLDFDNFRSINAMTLLIDRKVNGK